MTPERYRLDFFTAHLCSRLEGVRRSYAHRPDELAEALGPIVDRELEDASSEFRELMGDEAGPQIELLRREVHSTFLPRYVRLAQLQNRAEEAGYGQWRKGDPVARLVYFLVAIVASAVLMRAPPALALLRLLAAIAIPLAPFTPELLRWSGERNWQRILQQLVTDMGRIQSGADEYQPLRRGDAAERKNSRLRRVDEADPAAVGQAEGATDGQSEGETPG